MIDLQQIFKGLAGGLAPLPNPFAQAAGALRQGLGGGLPAPLPGPQQASPQQVKAPAASPTFIRYANQQATRNQPLDPKLVDALSFLPELGVEMEVFSGGQAAKGTPGAKRVGSTRHDHGNAADAVFYKDGRQLDWNNPADQPIFTQIVQQARQRGVTGIGAGEGYMRPGSMHIGFSTLR